MMSSESKSCREGLVKGHLLQQTRSGVRSWFPSAINIGKNAGTT